MKRYNLVLTIALMLSTACASQSQFSQDPGVNPPVPESRYLTAYNSCQDFVDNKREQLIENLESRIRDYFDCSPIFMEDSGEVMIQTSNESDSSVTSSQTNVQEDGVDEGDLIKSDGENVFFILSGDLYSYRIGGDLSLKQTQKLESDSDTTRKELYLLDRQLVVLSELKGTYTTDSSSVLTYTRPNQNVVTVYDIADDGALTQRGEQTLAGGLRSSRRIGNLVHLITDFYTYQSIDYGTSEELVSGWNYSCDGNSEQFEAFVSELVERNVTEIMARELSDFVDNEYLLADLEEQDCKTLIHTSSEGEGITQITTINVKSVEIASQQMISSRVSDLYSSKKALYIADESYDKDETVLIHRFTYTDDNGPVYQGTGLVYGSIDDQFSMGEIDGYLRIATTTGNSGWWGEGSANHLFVLNVNEKDLPIVGQVNDLAPGERIYSARHIGNKTYIVTFRQIDPLFVIDVTDPTAPVVTGELKIPGFSAYLHPLDENQIIGLGQDSGGWMGLSAFKMSLFDVSDGTDPKVADEYIHDTDSYSTVSLDHHAFNHSALLEKIAIPLTSYGSEGQVYGVQIFDVSEKGVLNQEVEIELESDDYVKRTLFLSNEDSSVLFILGNDKIHSYDLETESLVEDLI